MSGALRNVRNIHDNPVRYRCVLQALWGHVLAALRHAYESNHTLRGVAIEAPPGLLRPEDVALLQVAGPGMCVS